MKLLFENFFVYCIIRCCKCLKHTRGSVSLAAVISTLGGLLFILSVVNLSRYVNASNAVEQAARTASRCLTPSDGGCTTRSTAPGNGDPLITWWGFPGPGDDGIVEGDYYRYSASMVKENWVLRDSVTQILAVHQPDVVVDGIRVPVEGFEFTGKLFETRWNRYVGTRKVPQYATYLVPVYQTANGQTWYPTLNPGLEKATSNSSSRTWDSPLVHQDRFQHRDTKSVTIAPGAVTRVSTSFKVPKLPDPGISCHSAVSCGAGAGATSSFVNRRDLVNENGGFQEWAWIALKVFSDIKTAPGEKGSAQVSFGRPSGASGGSWGLEYTVNDPVTGSSKPYCLGGRSPSSVSDKSAINYNLWLRGVAGATGGQKAVCPGGRVDQSGLYVRRGSTVTVTAYLMSKGGRNAPKLNAKVKFLAYWDDYQIKSEPTGQIVTETAECGVRQEVPSALQSAMPVYKECNFPALRASYPGDRGQIEKSFKVTIAENWSEPTCQETKNVFPRVNKGPLIVDAPVCNLGNSSPPSEVISSKYPGLSTCSAGKWRLLGKRGSVRIVAGGTCKAGVDEKINIPCGITTGAEIPFSPKGDYGEPYDVCSGYRQALDSSSGVLAKLNQNTLNVVNSNLAGFRGLAGVDKYADPRVHWVNNQKPFWSLECRVNTSSATNVVRRTSRINKSLPESAGFSFSRRDGRKPVIKDFGLPARCNALNSAIVRNSQAIEIQLSGGKPMLELPSAASGGQGDFDLALGCTLEASCKGQFGGYKFKTLEDSLRDKSAKVGFPQAVRRDASGNYLFEFSVPKPVFDSHKQIGSLTEVRQGLQSGTLEACTPLVSNCSPVTLASDVVAVSSGTLSEANTLPDACQNGQYHNCYALINEGQILDTGNNLFDMNLSAAKARALSLLKRHFGAVPECVAASVSQAPANSNCVSIKIDTSSSAFAQVEVSYNMPLSLPFNLLLGKEFLEVKHSKEEVMELAVDTL